MDCWYQLYTENYSCLFPFLLFTGPYWMHNVFLLTYFSLLKKLGPDVDIYYNKYRKRFCSCYEEFKHFKDIAPR